MTTRLLYKAARAPPYISTELRRKVELVTVIWALYPAAMAPPNSGAVFPLKELSEMVSLHSCKQAMAPP